MFRKLVIIWLSFSVLLSATGLVVNQHFCLNQLRSVGLYVPAESCAMKMEGEAPCSGPQLDKASCCWDEHGFFKLAQEAPPFAGKLSLPVPPVLSPLVAILPVGDGFDPGARRHYPYKPPRLRCEPVIDLQTFRC